MKLMTQEELDNRDDRNFLYRCEAEVTNSFLSFTSYRIKYRKHFIIKETPKGFWVEDVHYWKKWVSKDGRKRFAYPTKEEALFSFIKRKEKQIRILENQLSSAKGILLEANKLRENENKIVLLEKELSELKKSNLDSWNTYGSELCSSEMLSNEKKLEDEIKRLKNV